MKPILTIKKEAFLSVDFGCYAVKISYSKPEGDNFKLVHYDLQKIPPTQDYRIRTVNFINNFLKQNSIVEKEVYVTLSCSDHVMIKHLSLPDVPKNEVVEAAKWQLKDYAPFDLENAVFDWQISKEFTDQKKINKRRIAFVAAKKEAIHEYLSLLSECNLTPVRISCNPFNYANLIKSHQPDSHATALLDIGQKSTTLCIYKNAKLHFIRDLTFSSEKLTLCLTTPLTSQKGNINLSYEDAEKIKETFGIPQDNTSTLKDNVPSFEVASLIRPLLEHLVKELKRSFDYFTSTFDENTPTVIYITGGGANLKNLDAYLSKELAIKVSKLPLPHWITTDTIDKERLDKDYNQISGSLGTIPTEPRSINLIPPEVKARKSELIQASILRLTAVTASAMLLLSLFFTRFQIKDYTDRLTYAQIHLHTIKEVETLKQTTDSRINLIHRIQKSKTPADGILKVISVIIPHDIILGELLLDQAKHSLILTGSVSAAEDAANSIVTTFMERIEESPFFKEASLVSSLHNEDSQTFQIICDLRRM